MKINTSFVLLIIALLIQPEMNAQNFISYYTGNSENIETQPLGGSCLMGGATENDEAMKWFLERANGGDVVVLRASGSDGYNDYFYSELGISINSVESIVCYNEDSANEEYIQDRIATAEAIWFAGGDQWNYVSFWRNTVIEDLLNEAIQERGIVIGGTSAGMAILGGYYFSAENGTITSSNALNNPYHVSAVVDSTHFLEVPYLDHVITDTHYDDPDRRGRHTTFMARMYEDYGISPQGIASEEYTSVCIDTDGMARVYGDAPEFDDKAFFIQINCQLADPSPEICIEDEPLTWNREGEALKVYVVPGNNEGSNTFDLNDWQSGEGGYWENWYVVEGEFFAEDGEAIDCTSSIQNLEPKLDLDVYPNPFNDEINIDFSRNEGILEVVLFDSMGRQVMNRTSNSSSTFVFSASQLPPGIYVMEVQASGKTSTQKLIKY